MDKLLIIVLKTNQYTVIALNQRKIVFNHEFFSCVFKEEEEADQLIVRKIAEYCNEEKICPGLSVINTNEQLANVNLKYGS
jgi:hypothetical protein